MQKFNFGVIYWYPCVHLGFPKYIMLLFYFLLWLKVSFFYVHDLISSANLLKLNYVKSNQKLITCYEWFQHRLYPAMFENRPEAERDNSPAQSITDCT